MNDQRFVVEVPTDYLYKTMAKHFMENGMLPPHAQGNIELMFDDSRDVYIFTFNRDIKDNLVGAPVQ